MRRVLITSRKCGHYTERDDDIRNREDSHMRKDALWATTALVAALSWLVVTPARLAAGCTPEGCGPIPGLMPVTYGRAPSTPFPPQYQQPMPGYVGQPVPGNWTAAPAAPA